MRKVNIQQEINQIKDVLVKNYKPQKIILFGSYAWGNPHKDSDLDLFIIKNSSNKRPAREQTVYRLLMKYYSDRLLPIDVIVHTSQETAKRLSLGDPFIREIISRGKVIYEGS